MKFGDKRGFAVSAVLTCELVYAGGRQFLDKFARCSAALHAVLEGGGEGKGIYMYVSYIWWETGLDLLNLGSISEGTILRG